MTLPARKKNGSASSVNALMPVNICCTATTSGRSATQMTISEHRTRANEIGTPRMSSSVSETSSSVSGCVSIDGSDRLDRGLPSRRRLAGPDLAAVARDVHQA